MLTADPIQLPVSDAIVLAPGLAIQGIRRRYERNAEIFGEGEPAEHLYRVVSGVARTIWFSSDGRRQILGFHFPGDVFGIETAPRHAVAAEAVTSCQVALVRRSMIEQAAARDAQAAQGLLRLVTAHLQRSQAHVLLLGRKGAGERVAAFLLEMADRVRGEIDLPMSRADIADYLALTIETVSRAFSQMERDHAIDLPTSRHVVVRDRHALECLQAA